MKNKFLLIAIFVLVSICGIAQTPPPPPPPPPGTHAAGDTSDIFTYAEVMPEYMGEGGFQRYLSTHIKYPFIEKEAGKTGTVYIRFIIEKDGSITNVSAAKEVQGAPGFTKEAIRVISGMPNWKPGMMNGRPVRIEMIQPIKFTLDNGVNNSPGANIEPSFPGGDSALATYIKKNLVYPAKEKKHHKEGTVVLSFYVEIDGSISDIEVVSEVSGAPGLTKEAKRLVSSVPHWNIGRSNGSLTRKQMQVSVKFKL